jgi:ribosomal protein L40E
MMATYYEILKVSSTATVAEIETALDMQYHHWRRLVTHHDPTVVNKANQALQALEQIRATLTDPIKRAAYDAKLGLQGPVGGLADPQARGTASPLPPRPAVVPPEPPTAPATPVRTDAWICPQCGTTNPVQSRFCKKCGQTLGINCPKCNTIIEATAVFCAVSRRHIQQTHRTEQQRRAELMSDAATTVDRTTW